MEYKFVSTIDKTGRFVLSRKIIHAMKWDNVVKVNVTATTEGDKVIITKAVESDCICPKCNKDLDAEFKYCPYCGEKI